ncbi:MAG: DUF4198 domain-containing protein [Ramlibacter sp.]
MGQAAWHGAACVALCLAAGQALSHDSWLSPSRDDSPAGQLVLELATGNRFPVQEFSQTAASVALSGCVDAQGRPRDLRPQREHPQWLDLRVEGPRGNSPLACWVELGAAEIEIEPPKVEVYLNEIRAPAANRAAWAALRERRLPWRESYRKYARIERPAGEPVRPGALAAARLPAGLALEIVVLGDRPIAVGEPVAFQVLRDGRPLAGFAVELLSERSPLGVWRQTDSEGILRHSLPFNGRWLLRGTDLRLSTQRPDTWESRFVTLALEAP